MVEARRRDTGRERTTEKENSKKVRFGEEEQTEEFRMKSTDQQNMMNGLEEVRTGRASAGLVRGRDEQCRTDGTTRKGRGKGNVVKGEHGSKGGVLEAKEHSRTQGR